MLKSSGLRLIYAFVIVINFFMTVGYVWALSTNSYGFSHDRFVIGLTMVLAISATFVFVVAFMAKNNIHGKTLAAIFLAYSFYIISAVVIQTTDYLSESFETIGLPEGLSLIVWNVEILFLGLVNIYQLDETKKQKAILLASFCAGLLIEILVVLQIILKPTSSYKPSQIAA